MVARGGKRIGNRPLLDQRDPVAALASDHAVDKPAMPAPTTMTFIKSAFPHPHQLTQRFCACRCPKTASTLGDMHWAIGRQHTVWRQAGKPGLWSGMTNLMPPSTLPSIPPPAVSTRPARAGFRPEPLRGLCASARRSAVFFWEDFGFWCFGGFDDVSPLLRDKRFGRQIPAGNPDSSGLGQDRTHLAAFDAHRGQFAAQAGAARPYAAQDAGQPRLRVAPGRAAAAAHRDAGQRADRRLRADGEVELLPAFASPIPDHHHCRDDRPAGRDGTAAGRLVAPAWSPCTCTAAPARPRTTANRAAREFFGFPARPCRRAAQEAAATTCCTLLIAAQDDGQKLTRGRAHVDGHPAAQRRP